MNEHVAPALKEQQAPGNVPRECFVDELLSRIDYLVRQELPGLHDIQSPVLRLEGILVSGEASASEVPERRVSLGSVGLKAWRMSAGMSAVIHDSQHQFDSAAPSGGIISCSPRRSKRQKNNSFTSSTCTADTEDHVNCCRKAVGGLRLAAHPSSGFGPTPPRSPSLIKPTASAGRAQLPQARETRSHRPTQAPGFHFGQINRWYLGATLQSFISFAGLPMATNSGHAFPRSSIG